MMILTRKPPDGIPCKLPTGYRVAQTAKSAGSISVSISYGLSTRDVLGVGLSSQAVQKQKGRDFSEKTRS